MCIKQHDNADESRRLGKNETWRLLMLFVTSYHSAGNVLLVACLLCGEKKRHLTSLTVPPKETMSVILHKLPPLGIYLHYGFHDHGLLQPRDLVFF